MKSPLWTDGLSYQRDNRGREGLFRAEWRELVLGWLVLVDKNLLNSRAGIAVVISIATQRLSELHAWPLSKAALAAAAEEEGGGGGARLGRRRRRMMM